MVEAIKPVRLLMSRRTVGKSAATGVGVVALDQDIAGKWGSWLLLLHGAPIARSSAILHRGDRDVNPE
jgi:hypothetical protein